MRAESGRRIAALAIMAVAASGASRPHILPQPRADLRTIAAITAGRDNVDRVRALYGPAAYTAATGVQSLCYHVEQDGSYLSVSTFERENRVRTIVLTTLQDVTPGCRDARLAGRHLTAAGGVALGDSIAKVIQALGRPAHRATMPMGDRALEVLDYPVPGGTATCQFEHGRLIIVGVELE